MRRILIALLLTLVPALVWGQANQIVQQQSPIEQALGIKLFQEINAGIITDAKRIDVERQLAEAQKQLAEARKQIEELRKPKDDPKP